MVAGGVDGLGSVQVVECGEVRRVGGEVRWLGKEGRNGGG